MIGLLFTYWRVAILGVLVALIVGYVAHAEFAKKRLAKSIAIAEEQQRANAKQALRDLKNKERSDENYQRNMARLAADVKRLRSSRASFVPAAPAGAADPNRACFDRRELDDALQRFRAGIVELIAQGAAALEGLDEAKQWAMDR